MHAVPTEPKGRRDDADTPRLCRATRFAQDKIVVRMPPIGLGGYLLDYWHDMGRHGYGAMGPVPLNDQDIRAWSENVCTRLAPWEVGVLKDLSRRYLAERNDAEDPLQPPPYGSVRDYYNPDSVGQRLGDALRAMARAPVKGGKKK